MLLFIAVYFSGRIFVQRNDNVQILIKKILGKHALMADSSIFYETEMFFFLKFKKNNQLFIFKQG